MNIDKNSDIYADHIFGDLEQPKNAAQWIRKKHTGVYHGNWKTPLNPRPGDEVKLHVTSGIQQVYDRVKLWYSKDDWQTVKTLKFSKGELSWDTAIWSYLQHWSVNIPPQEEGVMLRYKISAEIEGSNKLVYADNQSSSLEDGTNFSIWYSSDSLPEWAKSVIVYQIFVDRFNPGEGKNWLQISNLKQPFGGKLQGVTEKLPWIQSMGFTAIWLTPIFDSPSHHGYDTVDYFKINPRFGNLADFQDLVERAHEQNIKVILDFVANHCSNQHPFFIDALNNPESPYHDWFSWKKWPDYECFYNVKRMPKLNLKFGKPARLHLLQAAQYWLKMGVDGFRLDHANGPGQDFWVDFRRACHQIRGDVWTFGEVVAPADVQATYANGINGTLDFLLCSALRHTFAARDWDLSKLVGFLEAHFSYFPDDFSLPAFIDNHDMNRFFFSAKENKQALMLALLLLYHLPHPPIIYYGTETLLSQSKSIHEPESRGFDETRWAMNWKYKDNEDLTGYLAKLAEIRQKFPMLSQTPWHVQQVGDKKGYFVLSKNQSKAAFLILNQSTKNIEIEIPQLEIKSYMDLIDHEAYLVGQDQKLQVEISPVSGKVLLAN